MGCNVEIRGGQIKQTHVKLKAKLWKTIFDGGKGMKRISYSTIIIIRNCTNYSAMKQS